MQTLTRPNDEVSAEELRCAALALATIEPARRAEVMEGLRQMRVDIEREMEEVEEPAGHEEHKEHITSAPTPLFHDDEPEDDRPRWLPRISAATNAANAWADPRPPTIAVRASGEVCLIRTPRQAARERSHLTWLVVAAIPLALVAEHTGGITGWAYHVSASWQHMWAQTQASLDEMQRIYRQLHVGG